MKSGKRHHASRHRVNSKRLRDLKFGDLDQVTGGVGPDLPLQQPHPDKDDRRRD